MEWILKKWKAIVVIFILLGVVGVFYEDILDFWYDLRHRGSAESDEESEESMVDRPEPASPRLREVQEAESLSHEVSTRRGGGTSGTAAGRRARNVVEQARER